MLKEDYILRMIQMIGEVIQAALKLRRSGYLNEASQTLDDALLTLMPQQADLLEVLDAKTTARLLADPRLVEACIELLLERSELKLKQADTNTAEHLQTRAAQLFIEDVHLYASLSSKGLMIWGRLSGLELRLLLNDQEYADWTACQHLIESGAIGLP